MSKLPLTRDPDRLAREIRFWQVRLHRTSSEKAVKEYRRRMETRLDQLRKVLK